MRDSLAQSDGIAVSGPDVAVDAAASEFIGSQTTESSIDPSVSTGTGLTPWSTDGDVHAVSEAALGCGQKTCERPSGGRWPRDADRLPASHRGQAGVARSRVEPLSSQRWRSSIRAFACCPAGTETTEFAAKVGHCPRVAASNSSAIIASTDASEFIMASRKTCPKDADAFPVQEGSGLSLTTATGRTTSARAVMSE